MIARYLLPGVLLFMPAAYAQQVIAPEAPVRKQPPDDLADALKAEPKKAPEGKLCLVETPQDCGQTAELIRKPYTGGGDLYHLERLAKKQEHEPPAAPSLKPAPN